MSTYITTTVKALKSYPTYQFYAKADSERIMLDDVFKICVLEALRWIRSRLRNLDELPKEVIAPEPDEYKSFSEHDLISFSFNNGFQIDVIYIDAVGSWSFRMTEPDMGANLGTPRERPAVNGRTFMTEIAFLKTESCVEIGVRTICSEPEDTTSDCEVFRPRLVRALSENTEIRLHHSELIIDGSPLEIRSKTDVDRFISVYQNPARSLPIILVADSPTKDKQVQPIDLFTESSAPIDSYKLLGFKKEDKGFNVTINLEGITSRKDNKFIDKKPKKEKEKKAEKPKTAPAKIKLPVFDYEGLARKLICYAIVVFVAEKYFRSLDNKVSINISHGDIILVKQQPTERISYSDDPEEMQDTFDQVYNSAVEMMKRSSFGFGKVLFYSDAKLKDYHTKRHQTDDLEEKCRIYKLENAELKEKIKELSRQQNDMKQISESLRVAQKRIETLSIEIEAKDETINTVAMEMALKESAYRKSAEHIRFYKEMVDIAAHFPTDKDKVCEWIEENYSKLITVAPRAQSEMRKHSGYLDVASLCDGIVYLSAHVKYRRGEITEEVLSLYAERNNWEIQGCGKEALKMFRSDYTATVDGEKYLLDQHIKQGNHAEELFRVYFCWDDESRKIVIGSMPKHLPTVKNST